MSIVRCVKCAQSWNASVSPLCSQCECQRLLGAPDLISEKHDPRLLPAVGDSYRSCLSHDFVDNTEQFVQYTTVSGSWFYNTTYDTWNHFTPEPLGRIPGSGIDPGDPMPDHALDGLLIADALVDPHAYAVDQVRVRQRIQDRELVPLWSCPSNHCDNLCVPGASGCVLHIDPPLARSVE